MTSIFYIFLLVFIWNEIYYIKNKKKLDSNFKLRPIESLTKIDRLFYFIRVIYWLSIIIGLFSTMSLFFWILLLIKILQVPIYHISRRFFIYYENFLPLLSSALIVTIFVIKFIIS